MARLFQILFVACVAFALCAAEAPLHRSRNGRFQLSKQRSRFLARQEVAADAGVTPYPSAKELIPDIPFDETAAAAAPEVTGEPEEPIAPQDKTLSFDQPAEEEEVDEEVEEGVDETVAADDADGEHEPDQVYGPPEADDIPAVNEPSVEEQDLDVAAEDQPQSGRLTFGRSINGRNFAARPAKLIAPSSSFNARSSAARPVKSARFIKAKVTNKARSARLQQLRQRRQLFAAQRNL